ncbi:MAG: hypothetical protein DRN81_06080 [Thermoproteota archaeon]|nr:MAG: hypothetical protein DRN81_06080 [Candidatus Korarchaeota archaeon]
MPAASLTGQAAGAALKVAQGVLAAGAPATGEGPPGFDSPPGPLSVNTQKEKDNGINFSSGQHDAAGYWQRIVWKRTGRGGG